MSAAALIDRAGLDALIAVLHDRGFTTLGPVVRDESIGLGELRDVGDLPEGWHDTQAPGSYRLEHLGDELLFAWAVGQDSLRREVFPARSVVWRATAAGDGVGFEPGAAAPRRRVAAVGIRPCEAAALGVMDRVLAGPPHGDPCYARGRPEFVVVAECATPSGTCFCSSMGTGPSAEGGFDLAISELLDERGHRFVVRVGSDSGAEVLSQVPHRAAEDADLSARLASSERAVASMGRSLDIDGLPELLRRNLEHPRWDDVADRCLACGNCTLVCPTCFCATVQDTSELDGTFVRERVWASCFDLDHSYMHGGPVRESKKARYRQWMVHKLSTWWDQFGTSGCVGCGRCLTWCPVGIDITEEAAAIRASDGETGVRRGASGDEERR